MKKAKRGKRRDLRDEPEVYRVETLYVSDPDRRSADYWWREELRGNVDLDDFRAFVIESRWQERRRAFWAGVQAAWLRQSQFRLLQQRREELDQALSLRARAFNLVRPEVDADGNLQFPIQPHSWEGAISAFVKLDRMVEDKRRAILDEMAPMVEEGEGEKKRQQLPFTHDEMRKIAHDLLAKRRQTRRKELRDGRDEDDDDEGDLIDLAFGGEDGVEGAV